LESDGEGIGRDRWGKGVRWTWIEKRAERGWRVFVVEEQGIELSHGDDTKTVSKLRWGKYREAEILHYRVGTIQRLPIRLISPIFY